MNQEERKKFILNYLEKNSSLTIQDIVDNCKISDITARRDLTELENKGLLIRTHGGATKTETITNLFTFEKKVDQFKKQKEQICQLAAKYINDNDVIFIDCGTTLFHLAKFITSKQNLIVITNSLPVISELLPFPNIKLNILGGEIINERKAIYGPKAEKNISEYHANKAFIGADGISLRNGLTSFDEKEAIITKKMAEASDEVFLLCDSSKIEKDSFIKFAPLSLVHHLVTDDNVDNEIIEKYLQNDIHLIVKK